PGPGHDRVRVEDLLVRAGDVRVRHRLAVEDVDADPAAVEVLADAVAVVVDRRAVPAELALDGEALGDLAPLVAERVRVGVRGAVQRRHGLAQPGVVGDRRGAVRGLRQVLRVLGRRAVGEVDVDDVRRRGRDVGRGRGVDRRLHRRVDDGDGAGGRRAGARVGDDRRAVGEVRRVTGDGRAATTVGDEHLAVDDSDALRRVADRDLSGDGAGRSVDDAELVDAGLGGVQRLAVGGDPQAVRQRAGREGDLERRGRVDDLAVRAY